LVLIFLSVLSYLPAYTPSPNDFLKGANPQAEHKPFAFMPEVQAQPTLPQSTTVATVGIEPSYVVHSATNVTLYADGVAVNVVWDGVKRFDRLLNNSVREPWKAQPISYWCKWKVDWYKGTPPSKPWVSLTESSVTFSSPVKNSTGVFLTVNATMNDNSIFTVTYKILNVDGKLKWDLKIKGSTAWSTQYRFTYEYFTVPCQKTTVDIVKKIVFTYTPSYNVTFFYDDVNQAQYPVSDSWDSTNHKHYFSIDLGQFTSWQSKQIDPSTIATSTTELAVGGPVTRKSFYANGKYWAFYSDGTNMVYKASSDGLEWSSPTTVRAASNSLRFSVYLQGSNTIHYACFDGSSTLYYRRGTLNSDGSVSWNDERTVGSVSNSDHPSISTDSSGYPFIGYRSGASGSRYPYVTKSSTNDGTWSTAPDHPLQLSTTTDDVWIAYVVPMSSPKVMVMYSKGGILYSRVWSGSNWGGQQDSSAHNYAIDSMDLQISAVNEGDVVHVVWTKESAYGIRYGYYDGSNWQPHVTLEGTVESYSKPTIALSNANNLYVFWVRANSHIYYIRRISGTWDPSSTDWYYESEGISGWWALRPSCWSNEAGYKIGFLYTSLSTSPYNVKIIYYTFNAPPTNGAGSITDMDDANNLYAQKKWYTGSSAASDLDGYADIHYMEFRLLQGATVRARFQYHEDDNTFNIQEGSAAWDLDVSGSSASRSGNDITVTWKFKPQWDAVEESAIEIELYVIDAASASDTDTAQTNYADVVKTLTVSGFASNPVTYVNPSSSITFSGTVYYVNDPGSSTPSTSYPPDGEFTSVHVHNAAHTSQGSDTSIVNGAFSLAVTSPATVGAYTYHPYIDMADADYTDADATGITDGFTVTDLTATLNAIDGSSGTHGTIINVTLTWAHNSTGVNSPTVYVWDGSACIGEAVGNSTGFASVTTNATIHGSGTLMVNGTKSSINVNTPLSLSYSITVSGLEVQPQSSYVSGQPGSVTVNFKNEAVLNAVDLKLENVSLRWRVVIGEVQFWSYTLAIDDLAAASWRNQTYSITISGVPQTGVYTLRTEVIQLGSEWLVASTGKSVYITLPGGSPAVGGGPTAGGLKLSILGGAFETPAGKTTLIEVPVSLQGADVLELTDVSVNATWIQLNQTLPIQLNAGASKLRFMVTPPSEGVYTCLIAVKGKSGGQTVSTAGYFTLDTYAALPTPSGPAAQWILLGLAALVGGVFLVGTRARKKTEKKY